MQLHLDSYGARLRVKDGVLQVHYAEEGVVKQQYFAASEVDTIFMRKGTSVSTDAILLAMEHGVSLLITDGYGFPVGRFAPHTPTSTSQIQKAQALLSIQPRGLEYARGWILEKLAQQEIFLQQLLKYRPTAEQLRWQPKLLQMSNIREKLSKVPASAASFRGLEGSAGRIFYYTLGQLLPDRYRFIRRSRRPAQDVFNAFLNYAYALLYVRVEEALLEAGLNPHLGFMHRNDYQYKSLVYDFIEPFRMETMQVVYALFSRKKISGQHFDTDDYGGVWLNANGKRLLLPDLRDTYEEKRTRRDHLQMTATQHIRRRASHLAQGMLQEMEMAGLAA